MLRNLWNPPGVGSSTTTFHIYTNDMEMAVTFKILLYTNDSMLILSGKNPSVVSQNLSQEIHNCISWMVDNMLSMHAGKTEIILLLKIDWKQQDNSLWIAKVKKY